MNDTEIDPRIRAVLDGTGLPWEALPCDPALADTEVWCRHYGFPPERAANTIVIASKSGPGMVVACVLLATTRLDVNRTVRKRMGVRRLSFASPEETRTLTGMELGGVVPFALPPDLPVWVDSAVMEPEWVILGAGTRAAKLRVSPQVFARLPGVTVVEGLAIPR